MMDGWEVRIYLSQLGGPRMHTVHYGVLEELFVAHEVNARLAAVAQIGDRFHNPDNIRPARARTLVDSGRMRRVGRTHTFIGSYREGDLMAPPRHGS